MQPPVSVEAGRRGDPIGVGGAGLDRVEHGGSSGTGGGPSAAAAAPTPSSRSSTSWEPRITDAPSASSMFVPEDRQELTGPGTAPTPRPQSPAISAVISDPERSAASTTIVISASAAISRLRAGKHPAEDGGVGSGSSLSTSPEPAISR